ATPVEFDRRPVLWPVAVELRVADLPRVPASDDRRTVVVPEPVGVDADHADGAVRLPVGTATEAGPRVADEATAPKVVVVGAAVGAGEPEPVLRCGVELAVDEPAVPERPVDDVARRVVRLVPLERDVS